MPAPRLNRNSFLATRARRDWCSGGVRIYFRDLFTHADTLTMPETTGVAMNNGNVTDEILDEQDGERWDGLS